jgi:hypothetical protein
VERTEERAARNEELFREANERIERRRSELGVEQRTPYICECSREACTAIVLLEPDEYRAVRADGAHFLQLPGHADAFERVVAERDGYVVVAKREPKASGRGGRRMDERARRIGENEVLFREVNERLESLNEAFSAITETVSIVCECGHLDCLERISMSLADYEALRADATTFAVVPGHELPDVETVVGEHGGYNVVQKAPGGPAALAAEQDPRS